MDKHPPISKFSNIEAEKSLLGFLLLNNNVFEETSEILKEHHFYLDIHQRLYKIIQSILSKSQVADIVTVSNLSSYVEEYKDINFDYLLELTNSIVSFGSYRDYSLLIYDLFVKREIINIQNKISSYLNTDDSSSVQIQKLESDIYNLAEQGSLEKKDIKFSASLQKAMSSAIEAKKYKNGISGISTGLRDLDAKLGGLQKSDLIVLAGRPSMGKTALATNIAFNAASLFAEKGDNGASGVIFSLEMSSEQIAGRILASQGGVSSDALRKGMLSDSDFSRLSTVAQALESIPLYIDDTPGITIAQLRTKCRRYHRQYNIGFVIIDYIQLLGSERRNDNRNAEISEVTRGLKGIAKELNVPIIALSQLNRTVELRDDKKPMLSDLRDSGSIEQDADVVALIFREEYYLSRDEPKIPKKDESEDKFKQRMDQWKQRLDAVKNLATVIIAKNRHGSIGNIDLLFNASKTEFVNLDKIHDHRS